MLWDTSGVRHMTELWDKAIKQSTKGPQPSNNVMVMKKQKMMGSGEKNPLPVCIAVQAPASWNGEENEGFFCLILLSLFLFHRLKNLMSYDLCLFFTQAAFKNQGKPHLSGGSPAITSKQITKSPHLECPHILCGEGCPLAAISCPSHSNKWLNTFLIRCKVLFQSVIGKQPCQGLKGAWDILKWSLANKFWGCVYWDCFWDRDGGCAGEH